MPTDDEIDRLLKARADEWRASIPVDLRLDPSTLEDATADRARHGLISNAVSIVGITAILVALAPLVLRPSTSPASGGSSAAPSSTLAPPAQALDSVEVGDAVRGSGNLFLIDGDVFLCPPTLLSADGGPVCQREQSVLVEGVDIESVPGTEYRGGWVSVDVTVRGTWDGASVQATEAEPVPLPPTFPAIPVPCPEPPGGWPGLGDPDEVEAAGLALETKVRSEPDRFGGLWSGVIPSGAGGSNEKALVVGTVEDPASVSSELAAIYPFNLCVNRVPHSAAELQDVLARLSGADDSWNVAIDPALNLVVVRLPVLNKQAAQSLAPFADQVVARPTIARVT